MTAIGKGIGIGFGSVLPKKPNGVPEILALIALSESSIRVDYDEVATNADLFKVYVAVDAEFTDPVIYDVAVGLGYKIITGLDSNTPYYVKVVAVKGVHYSDFSNVEDTTTFNSFISTWNTENLSSGSSATKQVMLPLEAGGVYDFYIDWGENALIEHIIAYNQTETTHTYVNSGVFTVKIWGTCTGWRFNNDGDRNKILNVSKRGCLEFLDTNKQWCGCQNLNWDEPFIDNTLTDGFAMFYNCNSFNQVVTMPAITNASNMFYYCTIFNQPVDFPLATDTASMFNLTGLSIDNFNDFLNHSSTFNPNNNVLLGALGLVYTDNAKEARITLISRGWSNNVTAGDVPLLKPTAVTAVNIPNKTNNVNWTDNTNGTLETEVWHSTDGNAFNYVGIVSGGSNNLSHTLPDYFETVFYKVRTKYGSLYSDYSEVIQVRMIGDELVDQGAWKSQIYWDIFQPAWAEIINGLQATDNGFSLKYGICNPGDLFRTVVTLENCINPLFQIYCGGNGGGTPRFVDGTYQEDIVCQGGGALYLINSMSPTTSVDVKLVSVRKILNP